jgi:hypothetical protein
VLTQHRPHVNQHLADRPVVKEFHARLPTRAAP